MQEMTMIVKHITCKKIRSQFLKKGKKEFYSNLNTNVMTENRTFWKTVELYLAHKTNKTSILTLIEEEQVISQNH